jgi:hypothetical protein
MKKRSNIIDGRLYDQENKRMDRKKIEREKK